MVLDLTKLKSLQADVHPFCVVCSNSNPQGLAIRLNQAFNDVLEATFQPNPTLEGYSNTLHGGMTASLLDGIMTNRLFADGIVAVTAQLQVRYLKPVLIGPEIRLRGWVERARPPLFLMKSELWQEDRLGAEASAKFMQMK